MHQQFSMPFILLLGTVVVMLTSCTPKVGSEKWCLQLKEKPKAEWTASELADYTKHCLF